MSQFGGKDSKRHFTVVIGSKEHGLYVSSTPSSAARKAVTKLCAVNKSKKVEFHIREITQGSKKKTYGPYEGHIEKLKEPIELKGRVIKYKPVAKLSGKSGVKKGGMKGSGLFGLNSNNFEKTDKRNSNPILKKIFFKYYIFFGSEENNNYRYVVYCKSNNVKFKQLYIYGKKTIQKTTINYINTQTLVFLQNYLKTQIDNSTNTEIKNFLQQIKNNIDEELIKENRIKDIKKQEEIIRNIEEKIKVSAREKEKKEEEEEKLNIQTKKIEYNRIMKQKEQDEQIKQENFKRFQNIKEGVIPSNYQQLSPAQSQSQSHPQSHPSIPPPIPPKSQFDLYMNSMH